MCHMDFDRGDWAWARQLVALGRSPQSRAREVCERGDKTLIGLLLDF